MTFWSAVLFPWLCSGIVLAQGDPLDPQRSDKDQPQLLLSRVSWPIDATHVDRLLAEMRKELAGGRRIEFVVLELDSVGGDLKAAEKLAAYITDELKRFRTIAFIPPDKRALAEAALIALACNNIVMGKDSRIGADSSRKDPPAEEAALKESVRRYAAKRGYPSRITDAMVSRSPEDILDQRYLEIGDKDPPKHRFLTRTDLETQDPKEKRNQQGEVRVVIKKGELKVLSDQEAFGVYGIASHTANDLKELRLALNITTGDENVVEAGHGPLKSENPSGQALIDFLNQPLVRFVLLLCGCLALLVELKTFGTFVPGTLAFACFAVFFVASSFPVTGSLEGTASHWEILLFVIGVALVGVEFLLLPGIAIFAISGAALCAVSLVLAMVPADASQLAGERTMTDAVEEAVSILAFGFGAGSVCFLLLLRYLPHNSVFARRGLVSSTVLTGVSTADSALAAQAAVAGIAGMTGTAATTLRPAGKVELEDGRLLDVIAEGEFIEKGTPVKVLQCDGGITLVARLEKPAG